MYLRSGRPVVVGRGCPLKTKQNLTFDNLLRGGHTSTPPPPHQGGGPDAVFTARAYINNILITIIIQYKICLRVCFYNIYLDYDDYYYYCCCYYNRTHERYNDNNNNNNNTITTQY